MVQIAGSSRASCGAKQPMYTLVRERPACCLSALPICSLHVLHACLFVWRPHHCQPKIPGPTMFFGHLRPAWRCSAFCAEHLQWRICITCLHDWFEHNGEA